MSLNYLMKPKFKKKIISKLKIFHKPDKPRLDFQIFFCNPEAEFES